MVIHVPAGKAGEGPSGSVGEGGQGTGRARTTGTAFPNAVTLAHSTSPPTGGFSPSSQHQKAERSPSSQHQNSERSAWSPSYPVAVPTQSPSDLPQTQSSENGLRAEPGISVCSPVSSRLIYPTVPRHLPRTTASPVPAQAHFAPISVSDPPPIPWQARASVPSWIPSSHPQFPTSEA